MVDTSALLEALLRTPVASAIERRLFAYGETLHAPHLIDIEIAHVLRRYAAAGDMSAERGREALEDFVDLSVQRYPHDIVLPRLWQLRANLAAHDAVYVALAEALGAPLLNRDRRLARASRHRARVEVV